MAKRSTSRKKGFVDNIVNDPADVPELVLLTGYKGKSAEKDHTRLYLTPNLSDFYEIPDDGIVHEQANDADPLDGTYMWVRRDVNLIRKSAGSMGVQARFFSGDIAQQYLGAGSGEKLGPTGVMHCTEAPPVCGNTAWEKCPVGPTGIQYCTAAPPYCGDTKWKGCPKDVTAKDDCTHNPEACGGTQWPGCPGPLGPTGIQHCTRAPEYCGNTQWPGCPVGQTGVQYCTFAPEYCGNTQWPGCPIGQTGILYCTRAPQYCGNTAWKGCPDPPGPTGIEKCTQAPQYCGDTKWKGCPEK